ncbi:helix-turn-helix domain-containing protein [Nocardioides sp. 1609]|uniref:helix-turn-helix transcriptional regulator n=1 Tax=Nocardioides sp. 1609 TaxID=2508327 RepID=UPI00106F7D80|nr:helix-turn-helix domain-containing protein [Nocardioides sp. 1609]
MTDREFLSTEELADLLGVPVATCRWWRHNGTGPRGFRVGRAVRYRRTDVDRWIEEREREERLSASSAT